MFRFGIGYKNFIIIPIAVLIILFIITALILANNNVKNNESNITKQTTTIETTKYRDCYGLYTYDDNDFGSIYNYKNDNHFTELETDADKIWYEYMQLTSQVNGKKSIWLNEIIKTGDKWHYCSYIGDSINECINLRNVKYDELSLHYQLYSELTDDYSQHDCFLEKGNLACYRLDDCEFGWFYRNGK